MTLKTLKDIEKEPNWDDKIFNAEGIYINIGRLRQEAIKWYHQSDGNKHKFIKKFFNLTKEDLK